MLVITGNRHRKDADAALGIKGMALANKNTLGWEHLPVYGIGGRRLISLLGAWIVKRARLVAWGCTDHVVGVSTKGAE